ncbi:MAG: LCP family protein [Oscillospiraceae bacterium]|nr:LCP family protein [Oscillospiraceae bacterium]
MSDKNREKSYNTDNQETQYINFNQNFPENQDSGDTIVFKPLKKANQNQEYQRQNLNNYNNQNAYQRHNTSNQDYQRNNVNDYGGQNNMQGNYQRHNVNDYGGQNNMQDNYQRRNANDYGGQNNMQGNYQRHNVNDYGGQNPVKEVRRRPEHSETKKPTKKNNSSSSSKPEKKKKKKYSFGCLGRIIRSLIVIFLVLFLIYSAIALLFIKKIDYVESSPREHYAAALSDSKVKNILLIGTDTRDSSEERGRSDSMILLSLNSRTDKIYLTSIMRDSYVDIDGYGWDKLTHAYSYGGAELLMDTIEKNFSIRIDDYIAINFNAFAAIVDAVNGIEVEISDDEAQEINTILQAEVNELMGDSFDSDLLEKGGKLILNGKQALSYSRIRYVGNSDFERTQRQRDVMEKIIGKLKSFHPSSIGKLLKSAVPHLSTNMTTGELYLLSLRMPSLFSYELEQQRIPAEDTYYNTYTDDGGDALGIDFDANLEIIKDSIFE